MILGMKKLATAGTAALCLLFNTAASTAVTSQDLQPEPARSPEQIQTIFNQNARDGLAKEVANVKTLDAINKFRSAVDGKSACLGLAAQRILDDIANSNIDEPDAARDIIKSLNNQELRDLPMDAKISLIKSLISDGPPDGSNLRALIRIYNFTGEDAFFMAWESQKMDELAQTMRDDPVLIQARQNWNHLSKKEKIEVLQHVADLEIDTFGGPTNMSKRRVTEKDLGQYTYGQYSSFTNVIQINLTNPAVGRSFEMSVGVTLHEAMHAFDDHLDGLYTWGNLKKNDPKYIFAKLLYTSYSHGGYIVSTKDYWGYRVNPTERHAQKMETLAIYAGRGPNYTIPASLKMNGVNIKKNFENDRNNAINQARQSNSSCASYFSP